ncbi:MAG: hypothetical protein UY63_C0008G0013 [Parcubacteria group bacterium GW2011_GWA2_51_10]|nr:MAG: hypothetical protein UY63_C0008G0013 [Parcubacteria group bacterium GW2011_GWA2_51_10]
MRLLLITQVVDESDPYLSFFAGWIREFSKNFEHIHVICLKKGAHTAPANVQVHSLGKEIKESRLQYVTRLFLHIWKLRREYDAVLVHMNQEYILVAGWLWILLRKRIYMWRNHYAGNLLTDCAATFCTKVFCTSKFSYTAKYKKTELMPVGIDTAAFKPLESVNRKERSILFFGRLAPSKRPDMLLTTLKKLEIRGVSYSASFCGSPMPEHASYRDRLLEGAKSLSSVSFFEGVPNAQAPKVFNEHDIFVDLSVSGMYNKTIFEAAACGCLVLAASLDFAELAGHGSAFREDGSDLTEKLEALLLMPKDEKARERGRMRSIAETQNLSSLVRRLATSISS